MSSMVIAAAAKMMTAANITATTDASDGRHRAVLCTIDSSCPPTALPVST
jgi:hypothetical protein